MEVEVGNPVHDCVRDARCGRLQAVLAHRSDHSVLRPLVRLPDLRDLPQAQVLCPDQLDGGKPRRPHPRLRRYRHRPLGLTPSAALWFSLALFQLEKRVGVDSLRVGKTRRGSHATPGRKRHTHAAGAIALSALRKVSASSLCK